jgi:3-deoxy-D-manno-octulosonic-acid transferase
MRNSWKRGAYINHCINPNLKEMFLLYNFLSSICLLLYLPTLLFKKVPGEKLRFLKERLGISEYIKADIWVHAVSVGETMASLPFLRMLKREFPDRRIVFSTTTYTGQKIARERIQEADRIMYMPWDAGFCIKRAVRSVNPKVFITIETELWPLLLWTLKDTGASIVLLNGRISSGSFKGYRRVRPFMKKVLSLMDFMYMQGNKDVERLVSLGADKDKVDVMGNFKFDIEINETSPPQWMTYLKGRIFLAASTHRGEEKIIIGAYRLIKEKTPDLMLMIAPRHPERFDEVEEVIRNGGFNYIRRSNIGTEERQSSHPEVILLDTIGELQGVFSRADVAFIGGSLLPFGGHNILEPACWGRPIIFGPHMDNFPIADEFLRRSAAIRVTDLEDMAKTVTELLRNEEKALQMGRNAMAIVEENRGAVKKAVDLIGRIIGTA